MRHLRLPAAVLLAALTACGAGARTLADASGPAACGTLALSSTHHTHVIWVWMENHSYGAIIGSPGSPVHQQARSQCGLATNYHNISHPSLPNYIAATSGLGYSGAQRFTSDCDPSRRCSTSAAEHLRPGRVWKAYEESMPSDCDRTNAGEYAVRHNPPPYYTTLSGCTPLDVPYTPAGQRSRRQGAARVLVRHAELDRRHARRHDRRGRHVAGERTCRRSSTARQYKTRHGRDVRHLGRGRGWHAPANAPPTRPTSAATWRRSWSARAPRRARSRRRCSTTTRCSRTTEQLLGTAAAGRSGERQRHAERV